MEHIFNKPILLFILSGSLLLIDIVDASYDNHEFHPPKTFECSTRDTPYENMELYTDKCDAYKCDDGKVKEGKTCRFGYKNSNENPQLFNCIDPKWSVVCDTNFPPDNMELVDPTNPKCGPGKVEVGEICKFKSTISSDTHDQLFTCSEDGNWRPSTCNTAHPPHGMVIATSNVDDCNDKVEVGKKCLFENNPLIPLTKKQIFKCTNDLKWELQCSFIFPKEISYGNDKIDNKPYPSNGYITFQNTENFSATKYSRVSETKRYDFYLNVDETFNQSRLYTNSVFVEIVENEQITYQILMTETNKNIRIRKQNHSTIKSQTFTCSELLIYQKNSIKSFNQEEIHHFNILKTFPPLKLEYK